MAESEVGLAKPAVEQAWVFAMRLPSVEDLVDITTMELASYPADEAASPQGLTFRQAEAGLFFRAFYCTSVAEGVPTAVGELMGYICATLAPTEELLEETMTKHDPIGTTLCIHSVVTAPAMRRLGVAQRMLAQYIAHVQREAPSVRLLKLLTKPYNAPLYEKAGFSHLGEWAGEHGSEAWLEMELRL
eukprot:TRINITY_DN36886_c0_g1_i1.p1 TRINITY_DN36886_c0_g1~~TRINITY_DN36886_c0_g1_i1.p1  ORF type:complete len:197 (+),score=36.15 TRINITY_DN36886_c0_g1_i1:29-592(+)